MTAVAMSDLSVALRGAQRTMWSGALCRSLRPTLAGSIQRRARAALERSSGQEGFNVGRTPFHRDLRRTFRPANRHGYDILRVDPAGRRSLFELRLTDYSRSLGARPFLPVVPQELVPALRLARHASTRERDD